jgi:hypothetical protein
LACNPPQTITSSSLRIDICDSPKLLSTSLMYYQNFSIYQNL